MTQRLALVLLAIVCVGCANMNVQVDIVNPAYVEAHNDQLKDWRNLKLTLDQPAPVIKDIFDADRVALFNEYTEYAKILRSRSKSPKDTFELLANGFENDARRDFTDNYYIPYLTALTDFYLSIADAVARLPADTRTAVLKNEQFVPDNIRALVDQRMARAQLFIGVVNAELRRQEARANQLTVQEKQPVLTAIAQAKPILEESSRNLLGRSNLLNDNPFAYVVAAAPDAAWKNQFNQTVVDGKFGNVNTAIKLENLADFTIKGVTFDPSKVAQVASKVATQSLLVAAQIAGVPVTGTSQSSDTGHALVEAGNPVADAEKKLDTQRALNRDYRAALIGIGQAIIREKTNIVGAGAMPAMPEDMATVDKRKAAIAAISATFVAQQGRLSARQAPAAVGENKGADPAGGGPAGAVAGAAAGPSGAAPVGQPVSGDAPVTGGQSP